MQYATTSIKAFHSTNVSMSSPCLCLDCKQDLIIMGIFYFTIINFKFIKFYLFMGQKLKEFSLESHN